MTLGKLDGRTAIITGAAQGIGEGIALVLAKHGASLVLIDQNELVFQTARNIEESGYRTMARVLDITNREQVKGCVESLLKECDKIDILVNNAGVGTVGLLQNLSDELIDHTFDVNVKGAIQMTRAVLPHMKKKQYGKIINISSVTGVLVSDPGFSIYAASKGAIMGFTKSLAAEVGSTGIMVNAVLPGVIDTPMFRKGMEESFLGNTEETIRQLEKGIPIRRVGAKEEIGEVVAFLASEESSYVTGTSIIADGGSTLVECAALVHRGGLAGVVV